MKMPDKSHKKLTSMGVPGLKVNMDSKNPTDFLKLLVTDKIPIQWSSKETNIQTKNSKKKTFFEILEHNKRR